MAETNKWFKVLFNDELIGVGTFQDFARYSEKYNRVLICDVIDGEYMVMDGKFYHDRWMNPINPKSYIEYEEATVISISEKEYGILSTKPESYEVVEEDIPETHAQKPININDQITIEGVRKNKLLELSADCQKSIEDGFSLVLGDGASHHFSLSLRDQLNLAELQNSLNLHDDLPYHADGEPMQYYSEPDAQDILCGAKKWKDYNLALYNSFKNWINALEDISVISGITYESEIPDEYTTDVLQTLTENF